MAKKMTGELKFQLEIAKMLYNGELVTCLQVTGTPETLPTGAFSAQMVGDGKVFMKTCSCRWIVQMPDTDNPYDIFQHQDFVLGAGYKQAKLDGELNVGTDKKKKICYKLKDKSGNYVWVRDKYFDYFEDCEFWIKDEYSPVIVMSKVVPTVEGMVFPFVAKR